MLAITLTAPPQWSQFSDEEVGAHRRRLSPALAARIDAAWRRYVTPVTGAAGHQEFIAAWP